MTQSDFDAVELMVWSQRPFSSVQSMMVQMVLNMWGHPLILHHLVVHNFQGHPPMVHRLWRHPMMVDNHQGHPPRMCSLSGCPATIHNVLAHPLPVHSL